MHMYYWFGVKLENLLFYEYNIISTYGLISTCLGLSALAMVYESMKLTQIKLLEITKKHNQVSSQSHNTDSSSLISEISHKSLNVYSLLYCYAWIKWFIEFLHRCVHVLLGYCLMLAIMTFNVYISIAIVLGSGIGYYIFGLKLIRLNITKIKKHHVLMQCNPKCADATINNRRESSISVISENLESEVNINIGVHNKTIN